MPFYYNDNRYKLKSKLIKIIIINDIDSAMTRAVYAQIS